jgi:hypothetical protein
MSQVPAFESRKLIMLFVSTSLPADRPNLKDQPLSMISLEMTNQHRYHYMDSYWSHLETTDKRARQISIAVTHFNRSSSAHLSAISMDNYDSDQHRCMMNHCSQSDSYAIDDSSRDRRRSSGDFHQNRNLHPMCD